MNPWLDGYEHVPIEGCAGNYIDVPWRMVLHSTEGRNGSMSGLIPFFQARPCSTPHFAIDPLDGRKVQFIPLDRAAAALRGGQGGYETNRARCIQTEIIGFAAESHTWPDEWVDFIGRHVGDVARQVPLNLSRVVAFKGQGDGVLATENAAQRMSGQQWHAFDGVCGHQHVPFNDHWDPGKLNISRVLAAAGGATPLDDQELDVDEATLRKIIKEEVNACIFGTAVNTIRTMKQLAPNGDDPTLRSLTERIVNKLEA